MTLTVDSSDVPVYLAPEAMSVEDRLYRMWGIRTGRASSPMTAAITFPYPAPIVEWLHTM